MDALRLGQPARKYFAVPRAAGTGTEDGFFITTNDVDLEGDRIAPEGIDLSGYLANPVVLWLHDAYGMTAAAGIPIGTTRELEILPARGIRVKGIDWLQGDAFADRVRNAWEQGKIRGASIGFIPIEWESNEFDGHDITKSRMLEWSLVPVPANPLVVRALGRAKGQPLAVVLKALGAEVEPELLEVGQLSLMRKAEKIVPRNVSDKKADRETTWSAPALKDFTDKGWSDLSDAEKRHIAGHFAWANQMPPATYGDLKLPHHRAADGAAVFRGVVAAAGRLGQTSGIDEAKVKAHLAAHYHDFGEQAPWEDGKHAKAGRMVSAANLEHLTASVRMHDEAVGIHKGAIARHEKALEHTHTAMVEAESGTTGTTNSHLEHLKAAHIGHTEAIAMHRAALAHHEDAIGHVKAVIAAATHGGSEPGDSYDPTDGPPGGSRGADKLIVKQGDQEQAILDALGRIEEKLDELLEEEGAEEADEAERAQADFVKAFRSGVREIVSAGG